MRNRCKKIRNQNCKLFIFIFLLFSLIAIFIYLKYNKLDNMIGNKIKTKEQSEEKNLEDNKNVDVYIPEKNIDDWKLVLVNSDNKISSEYKFELQTVFGEKQVDKRIANYLINMVNDARNAKVGSLWIQSAYRSIAYQQNLYNTSITKYINKGYSREEAKKEVLKFLNYPGTSEHNIGLAIDFNYVTVEFEETKAFEWLNKNAENYGFILRYPKNKEKITKVKYEPWHYRYVGKENAIMMNDLDMCLEEFVEYLKNK